MRKVLLTGITGFVGRHLAPTLDGAELTAVIRSPGVELDGARIVLRDLSVETTPWDPIMEGIDAVVHLAAVAHRGARFQYRNPDLYETVNARATIAMAESAARSGVRHFIFTSTIGVHGQSTNGRGPFSETDPFDPRTIYAASKANAELGLAEISARTGLATTILRAPMIYGGGAPGNFNALAGALRKGLPLPFGSVANRRAFLGVDNLASFIRLSLARGASGQEAFIVADNEQVSTPTFVRLMGQALGGKPRLFSLPPALLGAAMRAAGREGMAEGLLASLEVDTRKARQTGWAPSLSLTEGLKRSLAA